MPASDQDCAVQRMLIVPGFSTGLARKDNPNAGKADSAFSDIKGRARSRDKFQCQGCGMKADQQKHCLHVHHVDFNHEHNDLDNLATLCVLCHGVIHLGNAARQFPAKCQKVTWFPEISQAEINLLSWTLAIAIKRGGEPGKAARQLADEIVQRKFPSAWLCDEGAPIFEKKILKGQSPWIALTDILAKIRAQDALLYDRRHAWLSGLRVFYYPDDAFVSLPEVAAYSESGVWSPGKCWEETWERIGEQFGEING